MAYVSRHLDQGSRNAPGILVTGGSGFIGQPLVKSLATLQQPVVSMYHLRLPEPLQNVYPVCSDMSSPELLAAPLRGIQTVVHLAWEGGLVGPGQEAAWDLAAPERLPRNIQLLRNLLIAMERAEIQRIIFMSAIGASRHSTVPFLMEKYLAEFLILNSRIKEKIILRSSVIVGENAQTDRFVRSIAKVIKYPLYPLPKLRKTISPTKVTDIVTVLQELCSRSVKDPSAILEITGSETYKVEEIFRMISDNIVGGSRLPVGGVIGQTLLQMLEKDKRTDSAQTPRIRNFLELGGEVEPYTEINNPLKDVVPTNPGNFREVILSSKQLPSSQP